MYRKILFCALALMMCGLAGWAQAGDITSNLEAYYKFNEGQGQWTYDSSGMGKDAVLGDSDLVEDSDPEWSVPEWGGYTLYFDGGDFLTTQPIFNIGTGEVSIVWFVQQTDPSGWDYLLANKGDFYDYFFRLGFNQHTGQLRFYTEQENNEHVAEVTDEDYGGYWFWGCVTRSGNVGTLYIDGEFKQNFQTMPGNLGSGDSNWYIGQSFSGYIDEMRMYSRALTAEDVTTLWESFNSGYNFASAIYPEVGQDDLPPMEVALRWNSGEGASTHDVYVGSNFDDVSNATTNSALFKGNQTETTFVVENLPLEATIYWRIDEHKGADVFKGQVWSFTTETETFEAYPVSITASSTDEGYDVSDLINGAGLENGQHDVNALNMWLTTVTEGNPQIQVTFDKPYKLQQMRVWNHNTQVEFILEFGIKEALIEYSMDSETWIELKTVQLAQAPGMPDYVGEAIPLDIFAQAVRITANSNFSNSDIYGLSELRFDAIPTYARELSPADTTALSGLEVTFGWRNSRIADEHKVYLDVEANLDLVQASDPAALAATIAAQGAYDNYTASDLALGQTYVWKVVEVNHALTPTEYSSSIRSFTTPEYIVLDDMESYDDVNLPWMTWADGYEVAGNGSTVGTDPANYDFTAETGVVHGGDQSLPIWIDNTTDPQSEATRTLTPAENWTASGVTALSLFVNGVDTTGGSLYLKINGNKIPLVDGSTYPTGYDPGWVQYVADLTGMNISSVTSVAVGVEGANAAGVIYVDDIRLYGVAPELMVMTLISEIEAETGTISAPLEVVDDPNASGGQLIAVVDSSIDSNNDPAALNDGVAQYTINIPADGDYIIAIKGIELESGCDSFWFYMPGMITNDTTPHSSGWLRSNDIFNTTAEFVWDFVRDDDGGTVDPVVFTLSTGQNTLQVSRREGGTGLDVIAILAVN